MDLSALEVRDDDIGVMTVLHPTTAEPLLTSDGKPVELDMVGMDSERYRKGRRKMTAKRLEKAAKKAGSQGPALTAEDFERELADRERDNIETVAAGVVGWRGIGLDAEETPWSPENVIAAFDRFPWLWAQANIYLGNRANFLKASPSD